MRTLLFAALLAGIAPLQAQTPARTVAPPRIEAEIAVDGALDEAPWRQAARLTGFQQYRPVDGRPAEDSTVVLVWYSPTAIHFGVLAYDRDPAGVRATLADRDNIGSDDQVTIFLDTFNDRRRAYFFGSNPLGVQDDGVRSEGGFTTSFTSGTSDRSPDFIYQTSGRRTPFGWVVEMRVPFKSLRSSGGAEETWGLNVQRLTQRTGYEDTWTDVRRAGASFLAQGGTLTGLRDIHRGVVTELQPTLTAELPGLRGGDGVFRRGDTRVEVGGNMRFGFTNLTLDGTINPDFSQVESDAGLVTINERFALFFAERRPFFLEGIELFASPNNLVYTRTVVDPLVGAKLTGKFGRWSVAHLSAIDEFGQSPVSGGPDRDALVNITRLRRDIGANSVAGITLTNRDEDGDFNRVLSADTRIVFKDLYYVQAQLGTSLTNDLRDPETRTGGIAQLEFDRTGRAWGFNYRVTAVSPEFETWSGFVNRSDYVQANAFNRFSIYGARGAMLEQVTVFGGGTRFWAHEEAFTGRGIEGSESLNLSVRFRGGWNLNGAMENGFVRFRPSDYATYQLQGIEGPVPFTPPAGVFDAVSANLSLNTPQFKHWDASLGWEGGETAIFPEAGEGKGTSVRGTLTFRPTPKARVFGTMTWTRLRRLDGREFARTIIPRLKVEVQPSRALFFRLVAEYRSERQAALAGPAGSVLLVNGSPTAPTRTDRLRMDWLASYEPTPGTVAFLGYGSTLDGERALTFRELRRRQDGFFVKVAYLFRK